MDIKGMMGEVIDEVCDDTPVIINHLIGYYKEMLYPEDEYREYNDTVEIHRSVIITMQGEYSRVEFKADVVRIEFGKHAYHFLFYRQRMGYMELVGEAELPYGGKSCLQRVRYYGFTTNRFIFYDVNCVLVMEFMGEVYD